MTALRLSPAEFFTCWSSLALDEPPPLLQIRPPGFTMADHRRILADTAAALRALGLFTSDHPEPTLRRTLETLARPDYTLDIRYAADPHTQTLGLAAINGASATVAISDGTGQGPIDLLTLDSAHAPAHLLSLAGPITPGRTAAVNLPLEVLDEARTATPNGDLWAIADHLHARGIPRADASSFARMCADIQAGGQLGATSPRRRGPWVIAFHRTPTGHYMQLKRHHTLTICPAAPALLIRHWRELLEAVSG
ncbi:ESX secretion-associated protein EspG [Pseudonocardia acaciae]|uniref:ESX secretion-associated protein EspG n=1 Tax=Pseudonocardia acaciae TaxID=551276 RepID=UPI00048AA773|nr:ESX secretion-associated protein EspG [Pseudonocardia acaciae]